MKNSDKRKSVIFKMEKTLGAFAVMLLKLDKGNNLVLGGSSSMILHGLEVNKDPEDVDIIIYNLTDDQQELLRSLADFNTLKNNDNDEDDYDEDVSVYKFTKVKNGITHTLDILIDDNPLPENLLWYINGKIKIRTQNIYLTIAAKASYKRKKDYIDLITLKNLNFNINE